MTKRNPATELTDLPSAEEKEILASGPINKTLTPEDVKQNPLKRGDALQHVVWGVCTYASKVRGKPTHIAVDVISSTGGLVDQRRLKVRLSECTRQPRKKAAKKGGTRLILARCDHCDLRIRASNSVLQLGTPLCFNEMCEKKGEPLTIEMGEVDGALDFGEEGKAEMARQVLETHQVKKTEGSKAASYLKKGE